MAQTLRHCQLTNEKDVSSLRSWSKMTQPAANRMKITLPQEKGPDSVFC